MSPASSAYCICRGDAVFRYSGLDSGSSCIPHSRRLTMAFVAQWMQFPLLWDLTAGATPPISRFLPCGERSS